MRGGRGAGRGGPYNAPPNQYEEAKVAPNNTVPPNTLDLVDVKVHHSGEEAYDVDVPLQY